MGKAPDYCPSSSFYKSKNRTDPLVVLVNYLAIVLLCYPVSDFSSRHPSSNRAYVMNSSK